MMRIADLAVPRIPLFPLRKQAPRRNAQTKTVCLRETTDLGESVATGVHTICTQTRIYICVTMEPKADALAAQHEADKRQAAGLFPVDVMWSAAAVNARWGRRAALCGEDGCVLDSSITGARGMTDAGALEVFFEYHMPDHCPDTLYLCSGVSRLRVK